MRKKSFISLLSGFLFIFIFNVSVVFASTADHLVISEVASGVGSADNEYIEIYNPTSFPITINESNFKLKLVNTSNTVTNKTIAWVNNTVPAFGYFLFAAGDVGVSSDASFSKQISSTSGVIISDQNDTIIDRVAWGMVEPPSNAVEGLGILHSLVTGESIERKTSENSTAESLLIGGGEEFLGNSWDTDGNSLDFVIQNTQLPQNSSSPIEIPEGLSLLDNQPPVANCGGDQTFFKNTEIEFDASSSYDNDGFIIGYLWDFGDGSSFEIGDKPTHIFGENGVYSVNLKVTDDDGDEDSDLCSITVVDQISYSNKIYLNEIFPSPSMGEEWIEIANNDSVEVDLDGWTIEDTTGTIVRYTFTNTQIEPDGFLVLYKNVSGITLNNTGDGLILKNPYGEIVDQYNYSSTSSDESWSRIEFGSSEWTSDWPASLGAINSIPENRYPIANAGANINNAKVGETLNFNGSSSSDPDGSITSYVWNFGDGSTASGSQVTHAYGSIGIYQVTLTVKDDDGASASSIITVTVVAGEILYQNQYSDKIKIIELMPNPVGTDTEGEYIKIQNLDNKDINLRNWLLDDEDGGSKPFKIDYDLILKPKAIAAFYSVDTKISLNNSGDAAQIFDPDKKSIDKVTYSEKAKEGVAYILKNGKWSWDISEVEEKEDEPEVEKTNEKKDEALKSDPIKKEETNSEKPVLNNSSSETLEILNTEDKDRLVEFVYNQEVVYVDGGVGSVKLIDTEIENKSLLKTSSDFNDLSGNQKKIYFYQKPFFILTVSFVLLFLIWKMVLLPKNLEVILEKLISSKTENEDLDNLFK